MNASLDKPDDWTPKECFEDMLRTDLDDASFKYRRAIAGMMRNFAETGRLDKDFQMEFESMRRTVALFSMAYEDFNNGLIEFDEYDVEWLANPEE